MALFRRLLTQLVDLVLYSNAWIALAALSLVAQTRYLLLGNWRLTDLEGFVFSATLSLYAVHRIIALEKLKGLPPTTRFQTIARRRLDIILYALLAGAGSLYFYLQLPGWVQVSALVPALFSVLYVLPVFRGRRRLRDFNYLKIFLVALVWTWVTVVLPTQQANLGRQFPALLLGLQRFLFIFAITIPFDIRDLAVDARTKVRTLPGSVGLQRARLLSLGLLVLAMVVALLLWRIDTYADPVFLAWSISILIAGALVWGATPERHDY
jgi:4-hydroxybenzoate polyprenyltransferase